LVARLLARFPAFLYLGVYVLVHAAVAMILHDPTIPAHYETSLLQDLLISLAITGIIVGIVRLSSRVREGRRAAITANEIP
jgi:predicted tellurium resistance membrane protein TerC